MRLLTLNKSKSIYPMKKPYKHYIYTTIVSRTNRTTSCLILRSFSFNHSGQERNVDSLRMRLIRMLVKLRILASNNHITSVRAH